MFGVSVNESRWFVSDKEVVEAEDEGVVVIAVTGNTDPLNEVPLVSAEALFRPTLCPLLLLLLLIPPPPLAAAATIPLTMHPGFA